jgi:hypothetical protein
MNVKCNDCHAVGEAKTNSRQQVRCAACYSLNVEPLPAAPEPIVTGAQAPGRIPPGWSSQDAAAAFPVPAETSNEPAKPRRKRGAHDGA